MRHHHLDVCCGRSRQACASKEEPMTPSSINALPGKAEQAPAATPIMTSAPLGSLLIGVCGSSAADSTGDLVQEALRYADDVTVVAPPTAAALFLPELPVPLYTDEDWFDEPLHVT